jgi:dipeptidase E
MKYLLTSGGVRNASISEALVDLLGKPISESNALFVPTAIYPFPGSPYLAHDAIRGVAPYPPAADLGWNSLGVLELSVLPSVREESWVPTVREADALLVWGGHVSFLHYWMRKSGLADLFPSLNDLVYLGVSAGSIVVTPYNCDAEFNVMHVPDGSEIAVNTENALGLIDVTLYPHLNRTDMPPTPLDEMEEWASTLSVPAYAIDDDTALKVVDGVVEVISEGTWKLLNPDHPGR